MHRRYRSLLFRIFQLIAISSNIYNRCLSNWSFYLLWNELTWTGQRSLSVSRSAQMRWDQMSDANAPLPRGTTNTLRPIRPYCLTPCSHETTNESHRPSAAPEQSRTRQTRRKNQDNWMCDGWIIPAVLYWQAMHTALDQHWSPPSTRTHAAVRVTDTVGTRDRQFTFLPATPLLWT